MGSMGVMKDERGRVEISTEMVEWEHPEAERLRNEQQREIAIRYNGPDAEPEVLGSFDDVESIVATVLLRLDGVAVAVGSVRDLAGIPDELGGTHPAGTGEVKRVYVEPGARGQGLSRRVVVELEDRARAVGLTRLVLESGMMQPEAMGLYLSLGYDPIETYGPYAGFPGTRCFAKELSSRGPSDPGGPARVHVRAVAWDDPGATALRRENFELSTSVLYPEAGDAGFEALDASAGARVVATLVADPPEGPAPVGCVALTEFAPDGIPQAGVGEIRKLFVSSGARGGGVARALVAAIEDEARGRGVRRLVLETGIRQGAAVRLYVDLGYRPIRPYPPYGDSLVALCFAKDLDAGRGRAGARVAPPRG